jgi:hypothetical protein
MAKPTTEQAQRFPPPPYTHWDQRGEPVLLTDLDLMNGKTLRLSLQTQDPDSAKGHMRFLVGMLVVKGSLSPNGGAVRVYGPKGTDRSRLKKIDTEIQRLKAVSDATYGSEALVTAKRWRRPVGIIHHLAGRKPATAAGTLKTRRSRARHDRDQRFPLGNTWEHHAQGVGKYYYWNRGVLTARVNFDGKRWQWPLKDIEEEQEAKALMEPVRIARARLHKAAIDALAFEIGTDQAGAAAKVRKGARVKLATAILSAGGPPELADFVLEGPREDAQEPEVMPGPTQLRASKKAAIEKCVRAYMDLIEANPFEAPSARADLEKKMMKDFGMLRDEARIARAEAIRRKRPLLQENSKWERGGAPNKKPGE